MRVLIEADRVPVLPEIQTMFEALKDPADGIAKAKIETPSRSTGNELAELTAALEKHFGKKIEATVEGRARADRRRARHSGRRGHRRNRAGTVAGDGRAVAGLKAFRQKQATNSIVTPRHLSDRGRREESCN